MTVHCAEQAILDRSEIRAPCGSIRISRSGRVEASAVPRLGSLVYEPPGMHRTILLLRTVCLLWKQGIRRHLWFVSSPETVGFIDQVMGCMEATDYDAVAEGKAPFTVVPASIPVFSPTALDEDSLLEGVCVLTYSALSSSTVVKRGNNSKRIPRLAQIVSWFYELDYFTYSNKLGTVDPTSLGHGLAIFDDFQRVSGVFTNLGVSKPLHTASQLMDIQARLANARVVYCAYGLGDSMEEFGGMDRLGLYERPISGGTQSSTLSEPNSGSDAFDLSADGSQENSDYTPENSTEQSAVPSIKPEANTPESVTISPVVSPTSSSRGSSIESANALVNASTHSKTILRSSTSFAFPLRDCRTMIRTGRLYGPEMQRLQVLMYKRFLKVQGALHEESIDYFEDIRMFEGQVTMRNLECRMSSPRVALYDSMIAYWNDLWVHITLANPSGSESGSSSVESMTLSRAYWTARSQFFTSLSMSMKYNSLSELLASFCSESGLGAHSDQKGVVPGQIALVLPAAGEGQEKSSEEALRGRATVDSPLVVLHNYLMRTFRCTDPHSLLSRYKLAGQPSTTDCCQKSDADAGADEGGFEDRGPSVLDSTEGVIEASSTEDEDQESQLNASSKKSRWIKRRPCIENYHMYNWSLLSSSGAGTSIQDLTLRSKHGFGAKSLRLGPYQSVTLSSGSRRSTVASASSRGISSQGDPEVDDGESVPDDDSQRRKSKRKYEDRKFAQLDSRRPLKGSSAAAATRGSEIPEYRRKQLSHGLMDKFAALVSPDLWSVIGFSVTDLLNRPESESFSSRVFVTRQVNSLHLPVQVPATTRHLIVLEPSASLNDWLAYRHSRVYGRETLAPLEPLTVTMVTSRRGAEARLLLGNVSNMALRGVTVDQWLTGPVDASRMDHANARSFAHAGLEQFISKHREFARSVASRPVDVARLADRIAVTLPIEAQTRCISAYLSEVRACRESDTKTKKPEPDKTLLMKSDSEPDPPGARYCHDVLRAAAVMTDEFDTLLAKYPSGAFPTRSCEKLPFRLQEHATTEDYSSHPRLGSVQLTFLDAPAAIVVDSARLV